jgi:hypothetical protein
VAYGSDVAAMHGSDVGQSNADTWRVLIGF